MRISVCSFIVFTLLQGSSIPASAAGDASRVPLHWLWNEHETDSAYTVNPNRRDLLVRERGYVDMGVLALVDSVPSQATRPLRCFYFPAPRTNTFCSISIIEERTIRGLGYVFASEEGYLRVRSTEGTVPIFRLSRAYGKGDDREHRFVISEQELVRMREQGWAFDGVKGYVFPAP
jgi:hypothetical protein